MAKPQPADSGGQPSGALRTVLLDFLERHFQKATSLTNQPNIHFVISAPRSGSTWLTTAMNHHQDIFATEHRLFGEFCEVWNNNDGTTSPRITFDKYAKSFAVHYFHDAMGLDRHAFLESMQRSFVNFIVGYATRRTGASIVVDKITPYPGTSEMVVGKIRSLFPGSKIVQLVRDGRDVLTSGTYDWILKDAVGTPRHRFVVEKKQAHLKRFFDDDVIEKWANNWKETLLPFDDQPADVKVTYEAMKRDLTKELNKIFACVGASGGGDGESDDPAESVAQKAARETVFENMTGRQSGDDQSPTAKARKGVAGDWKRHFTIRDGRLFHQIAGDHLISNGYESDPLWFESLPQTLDWSQEH